MNRICIAHGGDISTPSGGTDRISAFAGGLADKGHEVTLVVPDMDGEPQHGLEGVSIRTVSVPSPIDNSVSTAASIARRARVIARRQNATLQYEHSIMAGLGTLAGASSFVLDMHDLAYSRYDHVESPFSPALKYGVKWLEQRGATRADRIIVVSEYMARELQTEWGVSAGKISVIPNGYFPEKFAGHQDVAVEDGRVCFLGTLHPKVDIDAIERICQLSVVNELVVIGDGAQRNRFEALEDEYSELQVTGRLPDSEAFETLASAEVAINPQHESELQRSSSPVKLYYYAALGKPMVITEGPPVVADLASENAAIAADSRESFVDGVSRVLSDPNLAAELRTNALEQAKRYDWNTRIDALAQTHE